MDQIDKVIGIIAQALILKIAEYRAEHKTGTEKLLEIGLSWEDLGGIGSHKFNIFYGCLCKMKDEGLINDFKAIDPDKGYFDFGGKKFHFLSDIQENKKGEPYFSYQGKPFFLKDGKYIEWNEVGQDEIEDLDLPGIFLVRVDKNFEAIYDRSFQPIKKEVKPVKLPKGKSWDNITLKFRNDYDIEIWIDGEFFKSTNNREMGMYKGNVKKEKDDRDEQWKFLQLLSTGGGAFDLNGIGNIKEKERMKQQKKKLKEALGSFFELRSDPFFDFEDKNMYKTRFALEPVSELRRDGEIHGTREKVQTSYLSYFLDKETADRLSGKRKTS